MKYIGLCALISVVALCVSAGIPQSEYDALKALYVATNGDSWTNNKGWLKEGTNPCTDWYGVTCYPNGNNVQSLSLSNNNLEGKIPEEIKDLVGIKSVDFGLNKLGGDLPKGFFTLAKMYAMSLKENKFTGPLDFSNMVDLQFAHLDFNSFTGSLNSFCSCQNLKVLGLVNNAMTGSIPDCFVSLTQLQTLMLGGNSLSGPVPAFSAQSLRAIDVSRNRLTGAPAFSKFMSAPEVTELDFFGNMLSGPISGLSGHGSIVVFDVHDNKMTGTIPYDYPISMRNLFVLHAQKNNLHGFLPELFNITRIASFDFSDNHLYCPLPKFPKSGTATCQYWKLSLANPSRCTVGRNCFIVVMGSGFVPGEKASCSFGNAGSVPATVVSSAELRCVFVPKMSGRFPMSITVDNKIVTSNSILFDFSNPSVEKPVVRRSTDYEPVHVRIHGESKCPDFGSIVGIFQKLMHALGPNVIDLQLGFIMKDIPEYATGFWSLHGQSEVIGNALIKCVEKYYNVTTAIDFAACMAKKIDLVPTTAATCAKELNIDYDTVRTCSFSATGKDLLKSSMVLADKDKAVWSPTIIINDQLYCLWHSNPCKATKDDDFRQAICKAYTGPLPDACK